jgi:hypothetical protein
VAAGLQQFELFLLELVMFQEPHIKIIIINY